MTVTFCHNPRMILGGGIISLSILEASVCLDMEQTSSNIRHFRDPCEHSSTADEEVSGKRLQVFPWKLGYQSLSGRRVLCSLRINPKFSLEQIAKILFLLQFTLLLISPSPQKCGLMILFPNSVVIQCVISVQSKNQKLFFFFFNF